MADAPGDPADRRTISRNGAGNSEPSAPASRCESEFRERSFCDESGRTWRVRVEGGGLIGTGEHGLARLLALRFYSEDSENPREVLVPGCRLEVLHERELLEWLRRARPVARRPPSPA